MIYRQIDQSTVTSLGNTKGAYVFVFLLVCPTEVTLRGRLRATLLPGWYLYCGSANGPGGMQSRLKRHFRRDKKIHWHIDRLTTEAADIMAYAFEGGSECKLVRQLCTTGDFRHVIAGFGSSDCHACESHLLMPRLPMNGGRDSVNERLRGFF